MKLEPADQLRPGPAAVSETSEFAPIASAGSIDWSALEGDAGPPAGGGRIVIDLGGRWERRAEDAEWRKVVVPDNYGHDEEFSEYFGPMFYKRSFADPRVGAPEGNPQRTRLCFAAVDYFADVWLNDEVLGHHEGCFAPFGFDVTDRLRRSNEVLVRVQDPLEPLDPDQFFFTHKKRIIKGTLKYHDSRPGGLPGRMANPLEGDDSPAVWTPEWGQSMTTAGIVGPVTLTRTGDLAISALFVTPLDHETGAVQIAVVLTNHTDVDVAAVLHLAVAEDRSAFAVMAPPGSSRVDVGTDLPTLARWEPVHSAHGSPQLHELVAVAVVADRVTDRRTTTFGLRSARVVTDADGRARHLEVNGRPVFVKAVNYIPWQHFAEVGRSFYDRDMRLIAEAHANSIGVHAHVQSPHAYDAADAAGVLTFQDFPLQWFYDSGTETNPGFVEEAQRQIADMAYLLHSHPSVVYYACHNEPLRMFVPTRPEDDTPERDIGERHLDAALFSTLRSIEASRHVHEASGIGDDVHSYQGSLTGRDLYRVSELPAWFVSEYGFWTVGPQAAKFGDRGWPPTTAQMREWVSRLSFIGSTVGFAGMPDRYPSLETWAAATEAYGAALAKHQTEWFRIHRGAPFMGYRWHFWADWWGYAGGGLVDIERAPKHTYAAFRDASRPVLVTARTDRSVYEPGTVNLPIFMINDTEQAWSGPVEWEVADSSSDVITPDPAGFRIGLTFPDDGVLVAVPHSTGAIMQNGSLTVDVEPEQSTRIGELNVHLELGTSRTVTFRWGDETNFVHLHCPASGATYPPGLSEVS
ncbi:MAG: glycosyl hydrolase 2 galactose-binding domain-containing protein [Acidimicrobiia bacterium]